MDSSSSFPIEDIHETVSRYKGHGSISVLHVDDEPGFANLVSIFLEKEDSSLEVLSETNVEAGLKRLETAHVDCVVSDFDMPQTDGLAFLDEVRDRYPSLPFILFTGKGSEEIASEAISRGVTDYLQKAGGTDQYAVLANRIRNVVERSRAEDGVRDGFEAMETAKEGIGLLDEEGVFVYVNPAYANTYGYEREELLGQHWEILYPEDHLDRLYEEILPSVPESGNWNGESVHLAKSGERLIVDHTLAYATSGTLICLTRDITQEKETEQTLEQERQRFELFVDAVQDYAIFSLDPDGYITSWNQGAEQIKGYAADEIIGKHISIFYPEEKTEAGYVEELLAEARSEGAVEDKGWRIRKNGTPFWADVVISAVFDEGQHRGYLKVTQDLTIQRKEQIDLEHERDFMEMALNILDDVFYVLDADGEFVQVTDRATEVTGYTREELFAMSPTDLFAPKDQAEVRADIEQALATGRSELEADIVTKDGRRIPFEFRKRRFTDEGLVLGVAGIGRDISDRKRRERQLEHQLHQFNHFGDVLSHDLRTPLTIAHGRLELAEETGDPAHIGPARTALDRLDSLITDLASVMRDGEIVNDVTTVPLAETLRSVWTAMDQKAATQNIETDMSVQADETALQRLAENLFKNALEHGGDGVTVTIGALPDGFYVEDDGPGIPQDERERVFEAGYSLAERGGGFGLASVRQIVVSHGWKIAIVDGENGGARFEITGVTVER